jgi:DNA polymerase-3 subunit epsilon
LQPFSGYCSRLTDSLGHARELHPGQRNSLDALCQRYGIANDHRVLHGALLDARLLAEVYLAMTRGQEALLISAEDDDDARETGIALESSGLIVRRANEEELLAHEASLQEIDRVSGGRRLWPHQA